MHPCLHLGRLEDQEKVPKTLYHLSVCFGALAAEASNGPEHVKEEGWHHSPNSLCCGYDGEKDESHRDGLHVVGAPLGTGTRQYIRNAGRAKEYATNQQWGELAGEWLALYVPVCMAI